MSTDTSLVIVNPWRVLRQFTAARIALGRTGVSQPTNVQLAFQQAHASARDAVQRALDSRALAQALSAGLAQDGAGCLALHSAAPTRAVYLQRPDLGRRLDLAARQTLEAWAASAPPWFDLAVVVADGLSALAIEQNAVPFLRALLPKLARDDWSLAPIVIVSQGRVAIGDEIGELLGAQAVLVLIGERPGLSSPDSMGLYLTWGPSVGLTDDSRNCISNIRPAGLDYETAAVKLAWLLGQARKRQLSGVRLKDETEAGAARVGASHRNFLAGP